MELLIDFLLVAALATVLTDKGRAAAADTARTAWKASGAGPAWTSGRRKVAAGAGAGAARGGRWARGKASSARSGLAGKASSGWSTVDYPGRGSWKARKSEPVGQPAARLGLRERAGRVLVWAGLKEAEPGGQKTSTTNPNPDNPITKEDPEMGALTPEQESDLAARMGWTKQDEAETERIKQQVAEWQSQYKGAAPTSTPASGGVRLPVEAADTEAGFKADLNRYQQVTDAAATELDESAGRFRAIAGSWLAYAESLAADADMDTQVVARAYENAERFQAAANMAVQAAVAASEAATGFRDVFVFYTRRYSGTREDAAQGVKNITKRGWHQDAA